MTAASLPAPPGVLLDVFVPGTPAPQGSIRAVVHRTTGRAVAIKDNNAAQKSWRTDVGWYAAKASTGTVHTGPVAVRVEFVMPRPKSAPKRSTPAAIKRPDCDKLCRAVFDALSGVIYRDDSQVVDLHASKRIAEIGETPGARIRVVAL